ncbi:hypothetical protein ACSETH_28785 [Pseudomonas aeruginosa]
MSKRELQAWQPGMEITSESQYYEVTKQLAEALLSEHTPEQLAVIAAQHLIYVDVLNHSKHESARGFVSAENRIVKITQGELRKLFSSLAESLKAELTEDMIGIAKHIGDARMKGSSKAANDVRHHANRSRQEEAMAEWDVWEVRNPQGKKLAYKFAEEYCSKYGVTM